LPVGRRLLPALLAVIAAVADSRGAHGFARSALLGAVPFAAVSAIVAFGDYFDRRDDGTRGVQALLWGLIAALLVLSCAVRSSAVQGAPPLAISSLVATLGMFALKALLAAAPHMRRLADFRPAKP